MSKKTSQRIKELRTALGMSAEEFATKTPNLTTSTLNKIEQGQIAASDKVVNAVCDFWEVPKEWITEGKGALTYNKQKKDPVAADLYRDAVYKEQQYIMKPRHKPPHNKQVVPVSPVLKFLLEKYKYKISLLDNVKLNKKIKVVAEELGLSIRPTVKDGRKLFMMNKLNNEGWTMEATSKMGGAQVHPDYRGILRPGKHRINSQRDIEQGVKIAIFGC